MKAQKGGRHFTWWCEQQWKKREVPCGCQNQVDASILRSLNRQQAKNDKNLLSFYLLAKKLNFSETLHNSQEPEEQVKQSFIVPQSLQTLELWWSLLLPNHVASEIKKCRRKKSARKPFPRKPHPHWTQTSERPGVFYKWWSSFASWLPR